MIVAKCPWWSRIEYFIWKAEIDVTKLVWFVIWFYKTLDFVLMAFYLHSTSDFTICIMKAWKYILVTEDWIPHGTTHVGDTWHHWSFSQNRRSSEGMRCLLGEGKYILRCALQKENSKQFCAYCLTLQMSMHSSLGLWSAPRGFMLQRGVFFPLGSSHVRFFLFF
jgi:hypothetical protein